MDFFNWCFHIWLPTCYTYGFDAFRRTWLRWIPVVVACSPTLRRWARWSLAAAAAPTWTWVGSSDFFRVMAVAIFLASSLTFSDLLLQYKHPYSCKNLDFSSEKTKCYVCNYLFMLVTLKCSWPDLWRDSAVSLIRCERIFWCCVSA